MYNIIKKENIDISYDQKMKYNGEYDLNLLNRLVNFYKNSNLCNYEPESQIYKFKSENMWERVTYVFKIIELMTSYKNNEITANELLKILYNFYRWEGTRGYGACGEIICYEQNKEEYIKSTIFLYEKWKELTTEMVVDENLLLSTIFPGNLFGFIDGEKVLTRSSFKYYYNALQIKNLLDFNEDNIIVEIGGGWGAQIYQLYNSVSYNGKVICFDLPEVSFIAASYLCNVLPDKKIYLYNKTDEDNLEKIIRENDIIMLPNRLSHSLKCFPDNFVDMVFNSHSLVEIGSTNVISYIDLTNKILKNDGLFFHKNHNILFDLDKIINDNTTWKLQYTELEYLSGVVNINDQAYGKYNSSLWKRSIKWKRR